MSVPFSLGAEIWFASSGQQVFRSPGQVVSIESGCALIACDASVPGVTIVTVPAEGDGSVELRVGLTWVLTERASRAARRASLP